jgi:hypothetical protein
LETVVARLSSYAAPGDALQLGMHHRRQPGEGRLIPFFPRQQ